MGHYIAKLFVDFFTKPPGYQVPVHKKMIAPICCSYAKNRRLDPRNKKKAVTWGGGRGEFKAT